eukprot:7997958-Pyramimonas_sp.AAC.1
MVCDDTVQWMRRYICGAIDVQYLQCDLCGAVSVVRSMCCNRCVAMMYGIQHTCCKVHCARCVML